MGWPSQIESLSSQPSSLSTVTFGPAHTSANAVRRGSYTVDFLRLVMRRSEGDAYRSPLPMSRLTSDLVGADVVDLAVDE